MPLVTATNTAAVSVIHRLGGIISHRVIVALLVVIIVAGSQRQVRIEYRRTVRTLEALILIEASSAARLVIRLVIVSASLITTANAASNNTTDSAVVRQRTQAKTGQTAAQEWISQAARQVAHHAVEGRQSAEWIIRRRSQQTRRRRC